MDSSAVTFVERAGAGAKDALRALQQRIAAQGGSSRLLASRDDDALFLLMVDGDPALSDADRDGVRTWRFRQVDPTGPGSTGPTEAGAGS